MTQHDPTIPWPQVTGMRHRLAHGYDTVDIQVLWETVTDDLPPLIAALESILGQGSEDVC